MKHLKAIMAMAMAIAVLTGGTFAQTAGQKPTTPPATTKKPAPPAPGKPVNLPPPIPVPADYVLGVDDALRIVVLGDNTLSGDFTIRPDGKIVMLQLDDIVAAGIKPEELKTKIKSALTKIYEEPVPEVFVIVQKINSRKVYITGAVKRQGPYDLTANMTISQLITMAGGLEEFADTKKIIVISGTQKKANGEPISWIINYKDISEGKNLLKNNIVLNPGDQVIVRGG